jgi:ribosomal small subunit protein bTHX
MGKGDRKTKRGKVNAGSNGKYRLKKKKASKKKES